MNNLRRQQGLALVLVLWLVVLLSIMATGHARNVQVETRLAARQVEATAARYVAEAAINIAIRDLLDGDRDEPPDTSGRLLAGRVLGRNALLSIRSAAGLVDINNAGEDLLHALFVAAGADDSTGRSLAQAVLDWRDGDDLVRLYGAEDDDYRAAGLRWTARDAEFTSVEELRYVIGMPAEIYEKIAPCLTVHSGLATIDLESAPEFVIDALSAAQVSTAGRQQASDTVYHITATVRGSGTSSATAKAVVRITGDRDEPYEILEWREGGSPLIEPEDEA